MCGAENKIYYINVDFHTKYNLLERYELPIMPSLYKSIVNISMSSDIHGRKNKQLLWKSSGK